MSVMKPTDFRSDDLIDIVSASSALQLEILQFAFMAPEDRIKKTFDKHIVVEAYRLREFLNRIIQINEMNVALEAKKKAKKS